MIPRADMEGGFMILLNELTPDLIDQEGAVVPGGAAYLHDIERRLAPYFERAEPRQRVMADLRRLLSPAELASPANTAERRARWTTAG